MKQSIIYPSAYIEYVNAQEHINKHTLVQGEKVKILTEKEFIYHLTHFVNNKVHPDGRIYMEIKKDGLLYANSVSPYSETFIDNIEEKIKDLVMAFHKKRYLTYSSCEGHGNSFRRYVGLAFADEESREYVYQYISKLNIIGVKVKKISSVINQNIDIDYNNKPKYQSKINQDDNQDSLFQEKEAETFNIQFHRNYESYCFLEIVILEEVPIGKLFWKNPFKNIFLCFMKKYFWDKLTKQITKAINDKSFKSYQY